MDHPTNSLSDAVVVLLELAGEKRASAERARRLARNMPTEQTSADLKRHALELELEASEFEERACAVAEAAEKSEELAVDVLSLVQEARLRVAEAYPYRRAR
jgi:acyl transferase domain-containing protein